MNETLHKIQPKDIIDKGFCYSTIEFNWKASLISIYDDTGHKIYNNYIKDNCTYSGIHLNTDFLGYFLNNIKEINFINNVLIKVITVKGVWWEEYGNIDINDNVKNIIFANTSIYGALHDALNFEDNIKNIKFDNLIIFGTSTDG